MIANCCSRSRQDFGPAQTICFLTTLILIGAGRSSANAQGNRDAKIVGFEVHETAGIRRRNDVVSTRLVLLPPAPSETRFRVLHNGKPIPSQLRRTKNRSGKIEAINIDFVDSFAPLEAREYQLEYGMQTATIDEPNTGIELRETDEAFHISNRGRIEWTVRKDLKGLFRFRRNPDVEYVQSESAGLVFHTRDGQLHRLADRKPSAVRMARSGPIACAVEFEFADCPKGTKSKVELKFVRTKSWVRATWVMDGGQDVVGLGAELLLALNGKEKMIDFGADDFVYTAVRTDETAVLDAAPSDQRKTPWVVLHGKPGTLKPVVVASPRKAASGVGGWAHVMDNARCTAIAVGDFAKFTRDRIEVDGSGRLLMHRDFGKAADATKQKGKGFRILGSFRRHAGTLWSPH